MGPPEKMNKIPLYPSTAARLLGGMAFLLVLASLGGVFSKFVLGHDSLKGLVPLFDLDLEENIPTYFSELLMLLAALLLAAIAVLNRKLGAPHASKWVVLFLGFLFMAYDEIFQVHDHLIAPFRRLLGGGNFGIFYFAWVIPGIALVILLGLFFLKFLLYLPAAARLRFLTAAALYLGGAVGVEMIDGAYAEAHGQENITYALVANFEETLELVGLIFFIWALLKYCAENFGELEFRFKA
jgi:hypothetical protein